MLQDTFAAGPQEIEDLWLPFFCVSTNLSRAQVQVHQVGRLWQFVRASMTIVGMIPPVFSNGDMLVDGGYLNNQPVDVMHGLGVQTVVVVAHPLALPHPPSSTTPHVGTQIWILSACVADVWVH